LQQFPAPSDIVNVGDMEFVLPSPHGEPLPASRTTRTTAPQSSWLEWLGDAGPVRDGRDRDHVVHVAGGDVGDASGGAADQVGGGAERADRGEATSEKRSGVAYTLRLRKRRFLRELWTKQTCYLICSKSRYGTAILEVLRVFALIRW
jgi:hypothetical protein